MNQPILAMDLRLLALAVLVLGIAVGIIWWVGRRARSNLDAVRTAANMVDSLLINPSVPSRAAKALQQRGLATPAQLATMTDTERRLLFATMAAAIDKKSEPEGQGVTAGAGVSPAELTTLSCPTCGFRIERLGNTLPMTVRCATCGVKVLARRDGTRIVLTVVPNDETDVG